jgi:hypothetical protein
MSTLVSVHRYYNEDAYIQKGASHGRIAQMQYANTIVSTCCIKEIVHQNTDL